MKKSRITYWGVALMLVTTMVTTSCSDDKDFGEKMDEVTTISSITIAPTEYDVDKNTICLLRNTELQLSCSIEPENVTDNTVFWTSSDETIATVSQDGKLITKDKCGSTVISVTPGVGFGASQATPTRLVKVIERVIEVEDIELSVAGNEGNSIELFAGDQRQLLMAVLPENHTYSKYKWSSDKPDIATVDEQGYVKTISAGTAKISVTSLDGGNASGEFTFVVKPAIAIEGITFVNTEKLQNLAYGQEINLASYCKLEPENATFGLITWSSNNESVATVKENGVLSISRTTGSGDVIQLTASTPNGINVTLDISVTAGHFFYSFENDIVPCQLNAGHKGSYSSDGTKTRIQLGNQGNGNWRQDFQVVNSANPKLYLTPQTYKYFAYKSLRPYKEGTNVRGSGVIKYDLGAGGSAGNYRETSNPYSIFNVESGKIEDKANEKFGEPNIYVIDLSVNDAIKGAPIITDPSGIAEMTLFSIWVPDVKDDGTTKWYDMYWMGTFKSEEELAEFINSYN